jgi:hypothetical protein
VAPDRRLANVTTPDRCEDRRLLWLHALTLTAGS